MTTSSEPIRVNSGFPARLMRRWASAWRRGARAVVTVAATLALLLGLGTASTLAVLNDPGQSELDTSSRPRKVEIEQRAARPLHRPPRSRPRSPAAPERTGCGRPPHGPRRLSVVRSPRAGRAVRRSSPDHRGCDEFSHQMYSAPELVQAYATLGQLSRRRACSPSARTARSTWRRSSSCVRSSDRDRMLVVVNVQAPRDWTDGVNPTLATFAEPLPQRRTREAGRPRSRRRWVNSRRTRSTLAVRSRASLLRRGARRAAASGRAAPLRTEDEYRYVDRPV